MQTLDYKSPDPIHTSKLAVAALVYGVLAGPLIPVLSWFTFGELDEPYMITTAQRTLLFGTWVILVGVAMGLLAINRIRRFGLRGKQLAYIGLGMSGFWALVLLANFLNIFHI